MNIIPFCGEKCDKYFIIYSLSITGIHYQKGNFEQHQDQNLCTKLQTIFIFLRNLEQRDHQTNKVFQDEEVPDHVEIVF